MRKFSVLFTAWAAVAAPAWAADEPSMAPAAAWVEAVAIPAPKPELQDKPVQVLLTSAQTRYGLGSDEYYVETAMTAQTPQGLAGLGTVTIPWRPDAGDLTVHKAHILRSGKVIDLLAGGQKFTVLRRENKLEYAMLDGTLTAVLQPEGLQVGDTLNMAFSYRTKAGSIPFSAENMVFVPPGTPVAKTYYREIWPREKPVRWRATPAMGKPRLKQTALGTELVVALDDVLVPAPPADAPGRFHLPALLQVSGYKDWNEISRMFAPLYGDAAKLASDSPLRAEVARISAASTDPRQRALLALRLVQDRIRYVALGMGEGGYIPATLDQTWSRKYGDCKGKTVMLIALLQAMGIEAEPVLVSTQFADLLGDFLPQVKPFDHVIVRAVIDGRSYWLDGTRSGDRQIEELASSPFIWGLPVRQQGATLEALAFAAPSLPLSETRVTYDASRGFFLPVPVSGETVFRGDMASGFKAVLAEMGREEFEKKAAEIFEDLPGGDDTTYKVTSDDETGTFSVAFKGRQKMEWSGGLGGKRVRFDFNNDTIAWTPEFAAREGDFKTVPVALQFPVFLAYTETIILPSGGTDFRLEAKNLDHKVAGTHITRRVSLQDGKATAYSAFRRLKREIGAEEAQASAVILKLVNADRASVLSPENYKISEAETKLLLETEPTTSAEYNRRGYEFLQRGEQKKALGDFEKAASLSPDWALPLANRAVVLVQRDKLEEAEAVLSKAEALDRNEYVVHQAYGSLHAAREKHEEAVAAYSKALRLNPEDSFSLFHRAYSYESLGRLKDALADWEQAVSDNPDKAASHVGLARISLALGDPKRALQALDAARDLKTGDPLTDRRRALLLEWLGRAEESKAAYAQALRATDEALKNYPDTPFFLAQRYDILVALGQADVGLKELDRRLGTQPDFAYLLSSRCWIRTAMNREVEKAVKDCSKALEYNDGFAQAAQHRGFARLRLGKIDEAISDFSDVVSWEPQNAAAYFGRGIARLRKGDLKAGEADRTRARSLSFDIEKEYERYGFTASETAMAGQQQ